jgi:anti-anti-sigma regulatory factor
MQLVIQQHPHQPVKIWLRGLISEDDVPILMHECLPVLQSTSSQELWFHLEHMPYLSEASLAGFRQLMQSAHNQQVALRFIVRRKDLYSALLAHGLPAHFHDPEPILEKALPF